MTREIRRGAADPLFEIFEEAARMEPTGRASARPSRLL